MWQHTGKERPTFAETPAPGQESVWDYPRPPRLLSCEERVEVFDNSSLLASTCDAKRIPETASPPNFYLPCDSVDWSQLLRAQGSSFCEWKGAATYWTLANNPEGPVVGWSYDNPNDDFASIKHHVSFYPGLLTCLVDGEKAQPQPGGFYGGWITSKVTGPFKGAPGTSHW